MSWELFHRTVTCSDCGTEYEYVVQHPPIPMVVRGFYNDEGRPIGEDCHCGATLDVPEGDPTLREGDVAGQNTRL